jgi:hypothetical protein
MAAGATREDDDTSFLLRIRRLLGRIRRRFAVDHYDVFARAVDPDIQVDAPEGYTIRFGTPEEIEGCDPYHTDLDARERREGVVRLDLGHKVVLGLSGDEVVFSMWVNPRNINIPGSIKRRLGPHQSFIYKAYTSPDHRGRKLYGAGMRFVLADMAREGKTELIGYAHVKKKISRKGLASLHFRSVGTFTDVDCPGWHRTSVSSELASYFPEPLERSNVMSSATPLQAGS